MRTNIQVLISSVTLAAISLGCGGADSEGPANASGGSAAVGHLHLSCALGDGPLDDGTLAGVREALRDEWKAEATYASLSKLGRPFSQLRGAEERHADLLTQLLAAHEHEVPARPPSAEVGVTSAPEACALALTAEEANVAMYDKLLSESPPRDVKCVYEHLRALSAERHIPALRRCGGRGR